MRPIHPREAERPRVRVKMFDFSLWRPLWPSSPEFGWLGHPRKFVLRLEGSSSLPPRELRVKAPGIFFMAHDPQDDPDALKTPGPQESETKNDLPKSTDTDDLASTGFFAGEAWEPRHPERIGNYRIIDVLGQGGMGLVYHAEQTEPVRRRVALKLIRSGMDTRQIVARFESERQTLALMNHPSIASVYDAGTTEDARPYFAMELVAGAPITRYCDEQRFSLDRRLDLFVQVCEGIHHAHQKAIIHRDLKPSNVLVTDQNGEATPKIIDFGIAKAIGKSIDGEADLTMAGQVIGTPEYMSPEQAGYQSLDIDTRTDIYSLGVILYELLVGALPFDSRRLRGSGFAEILRIICEEEPLRPSTRISRLRHESTDSRKMVTGVDTPQYVRALRGDLDWICLKALEKDRALRYQSVSELSADLERYRRHEPVLARPPSVAYVLRKYARKHRGRFMALGAVLAVACGFIVYGWNQRRVEIRRLESKVESATSQYLDARDKKDREKADHQKEIDALETANELWKPPWKRGGELEAFDRQAEHQERMEEAFSEAFEAHAQATRLTALGSAARKQRITDGFVELLFERYRESEPGGALEVSSDIFRAMIENLDPEAYRRELEGKGEVLVSSEPPGANVYCFRYEPFSEAHWLPIPFNPAEGHDEPKRGLLGAPFLQVERVWEPELSTFEEDDRLLTVNGSKVTVRGDVHRALEGVKEREEVEVEIARRGEKMVVRWKPFPPEKAELGVTGEVVDFHTQFGFTCAAYPLDFHPDAMVGVTSSLTEPLDVKLPRGNYLFVLRKEGHVDTRLPVAIPQHEDLARKLQNVRLLRKEHLPRDFLHVSRGPFVAGSVDRDVYEPLEPTVRSVSGFLMARLEVTVGEYLEFLNAPEIQAIVQKERNVDKQEFVGLAKFSDLKADWSSKDLKELLPRKPTLFLVPYWRREPMFWFDRTETRWKAKEKFSFLQPDSPVHGISTVAAREYAAWRTRRVRALGRPWTFRLPTDEEWEKAARGADQRPHVWGDYLMHGFCHSAVGIFHEPLRGSVTTVGTHPIDESVYGIRDLGGSVAEPTRTRAGSLRMIIYRGADYQATDVRDYHAASRNRARMDEMHRFLGIRLVADLPSE